MNVNGVDEHTLWVTNDNDFLKTTTLKDSTTVDNPNQFYVFGFTDADLNAADPGTTFAPQIVTTVPESTGQGLAALGLSPFFGMWVIKRRKASVVK